MISVIPFLIRKGIQPFWNRIYQQIPNPLGKPVVWIHGVSLGEIKAAFSFFERLRALNPDAFFVITSTTQTGYEEAKKTCIQADAVCYFPLDFSWIVKKWVRRLSPVFLFLIEGDFWPHLFTEVKKNKGKIILLSGKMSDKSCKRFQIFSFLSKKLFGFLDSCLVQNEEHLQRFQNFVDRKKLFVGGNLKWDRNVESIDFTRWKTKLSLPSRVVTFASTHAPEEKLFLKELQEEDLFFILAPRHPERMEEVVSVLNKENISFFKWSQLENRNGTERVLLIDKMGQLPICYSLSRLVIMGGSYVKHVGGHNVLEPCFYGVPVYFGPHMWAQKEFVATVLHEQAAEQVDISDLKQKVRLFFSDSEKEKQMCQNAQRLYSRKENVTIKILAFLHQKYPAEKISFGHLLEKI